MTKDKALKLALEWAEAHGEIVFAGGGMDAVNKMNSWVVAIKEALTQPEQQPVYQPPKDEYVRPEALDFKKVKSK